MFENLIWSNWLPLCGQQDVYRQIPTKLSGLYRIRARGRDGLIYIGQTGRCVRERLRALRAGVYANQMPYNDPHTAAPNLWVWLQDSGFEYEFSYLISDLPPAERQGLEDYFLWRHRQDYGFSTLCNYGRFHKHWIKPSNRKQGRKGRLLEDGQLNPAGVTTSQLLNSTGRSSDDFWMGLEWSAPLQLSSENLNVLGNTPSVYRIMDSENREVIYIGETKETQKRLKAHMRKSWNNKQPLFSFAQNIDLSLPHLRHEVEVDLIGAYFEENQRVPRFQYGQ